MEKKLKDMLPRSNKYPKEIYIKCDMWKIVFKKNLEDYGITDPIAMTITIKDGMSSRETLSTFIHELLHALAFSGDFKLKHKLVYLLETGILEILVDNFL